MRSSEPVDAGATRAPATTVGPGSVAAASTLHRPTDPIRITLTATDDAWVAADADGRRVVYRVLNANEQVTVSASTEVRLRIGNAGAVLVAVDDEPAVAAGAPGAVRTIGLTRAADGSIARALR
jgi:hypothetical protein